jgi:hypothetical protein
MSVFKDVRREDALTGFANADQVCEQAGVETQPGDQADVPAHSGDEFQTGAAKHGRKIA